MKTKNDMNRFKFATRTIHAGQSPDPITGAVMVPIYQTSTFAQKSPGDHTGYEYARTDNPTRTAYQECVASLENAKHALAFSSGLAAMDTLMKLLKSGDHVICADDVYGGTYRLFSKILTQYGLQFDFMDLKDLKKVKSAMKPNTKMIWIETPTNPMLKIFDIKSLSHFAQQKGIWTVVDNTFMSPYFQNPLDLGADFVVHSITKYMNGHSDVVGGVIATNRDTEYQTLKYLQNAAGAVPGPMDCFLVMRGLKTLHIRMERHQENAVKIAKFLESHPQVEKVIYPGLPSHPDHALAKEQMKGFGGMISFVVKGGLTASKKVLEKTQIFTLAESLGGVESLIELPAIMTHASIPPENREKLGISDGLIRISCGIEDSSDLIEDLTQALGF